MGNSHSEEKKMRNSHFFFLGKKKKLNFEIKLGISHFFWKKKCEIPKKNVKFPFFKKNEKFL
jgi:hypothetical protein